MKKSLIIFFSIISLYCFSQNSKEETAKKLEGYWVIKNSDSSKVYHYSFSKENKMSGVYEESKISEIESGKISVKTCQPFIRLRKNIFGYRIEYTSMFGSWKSKIKYLDSEKLILKTDGELVEYKKLTAANSGLL